MKVCSKCKMEKPLEDFSKCKKSKDGHNYWCRKCGSEYGAIWQKKNPDKARANSLKYMRKHSKEIYKKKWANPVHKKKMMSYSNAYRDRNRDKINERERQRRYEKVGLPVKPKAFSLYRDVIMKILDQPEHEVWSRLNMLKLADKLTEHQEQVIELAKQKLTAIEVANKLGVAQSGIPKAWEYIHRKLIKSGWKNK